MRCLKENMVKDGSQSQFGETRCHFNHIAQQISKYRPDQKLGIAV